MKYSSFCNEGCIDLNSSTLLRAPASAREEKKSKKSERHCADPFLYLINTEHLYWLLIRDPCVTLVSLETILRKSEYLHWGEISGSNWWRRYSLLRCFMVNLNCLMRRLLLLWGTNSVKKQKQKALQPCECRHILLISLAIASPWDNLMHLLGACSVQDWRAYAEVIHLWTNSLFGTLLAGYAYTYTATVTSR